MLNTIVPNLVFTSLWVQCWISLHSGFALYSRLTFSRGLSNRKILHSSFSRFTANNNGLTTDNSLPTQFAEDKTQVKDLSLWCWLGETHRAAAIGWLNPVSRPRGEWTRLMVAQNVNIYCRQTTYDEKKFKETLNPCPLGSGFVCTMGSRVDVETVVLGRPRWLGLAASLPSCPFTWDNCTLTVPASNIKSSR